MKPFPRCRWVFFALSVLFFGSCKKDLVDAPASDTTEDITASQITAYCLPFITHYYQTEQIAHTHGDLDFYGIGLGNKIVFALGDADIQPVNVDGNADIYDGATDTWSTHKLSERKFGHSIAATGSKIMIAGGQDPYPDAANYISNKVDLYDINTNTWTAFTKPTYSAYGVGVGYNNLMYFALGTNGLELVKTIEVYNTITGTWSTLNKLSRGRVSLAAAAANGKVVFAGGRAGADGNTALDLADIYDVNSGTWSTAHMSTPRWSFQGIGLGDYIIFAGGAGGNTADIFNTVTGAWTVAQLSGYPISVAAIGKNIYLAAGNAANGNANLDVFNVCSKTWSHVTLQTKRSKYAIGAAGSKLVAAGGTINGTSYTKKAEVYTYSALLAN